MATLALDEALAAGAAYADARALNEDAETLTVQDQRIDGIGRNTTSGVGVRALVDGAWGFAGTARVRRDDVLGAARRAV